METLVMNKRIQELAEQATTIVDMVGPQGYTSSYANFDREKFAELIVQECVDFLKDTLDDHFAAEQLEEHFGVETDDEVEYCPKCNAEWSGTSCGLPDCGWIVGAKE
jgi:hypothetical protein